MGRGEIPVQGDYEHVLRDLSDAGTGAQDPDRGHHLGWGHEGHDKEARPFHMGGHSGVVHIPEGIIASI